MPELTCKCRACLLASQPDGRLWLQIKDELMELLAAACIIIASRQGEANVHTPSDAEFHKATGFTVRPCLCSLAPSRHDDTSAASLHAGHKCGKPRLQSPAAHTRPAVRGQLCLQAACKHRVVAKAAETHQLSAAAVSAQRFQHRALSQRSCAAQACMGIPVRLHTIPGSTSTEQSAGGACRCRWWSRRSATCYFLAFVDPFDRP